MSAAPSPISGLLLVHKPAALTSNQVLGKLKALLKRKDIGHGGTLDSFATGVLPVLCGEALKLSRIFLEHHPELPTYWKSYRAVLQLGSETDTLDPLGEVVQRSAIPQDLSSDRLNAVAELFQNQNYLQTPPLYSAKKVAGQRASDRTRAGETVTLEPAAVQIRHLKIEALNPEQLTLELTCSKGTYVRALARDIAAILGTHCHLIELCRTAIGPFALTECTELDQQPELLSTQILPLATVTARTLPQIIINTEQALMLRQGKLAVLNNITKPTILGLYLCTTPDQKPVALVEVVTPDEIRFLRGLN